MSILTQVCMGAQDLERRTWNEQHLERLKPNLERRSNCSHLERQKKQNLERRTFFPQNAQNLERRTWNDRTWNGKKAELGTANIFTTILH